MRQDGERTEIYDAMLRERIGQALGNQQDEEVLDLQVLEAWAEERRAQKRQLRRRYAMIACTVFVCACAAALALHLTLLSGTSVSIAGKSGDSINETEGGAVIKDNQADIDENMGTVKITIDDWDQVEDSKKEYPDMLVPGYVPEGYVFEKLVIEGNALKRKYTFFFLNGNTILSIKESEKAVAASIYDYDEVLKVENYQVFVNSNEDVAYFEMENIFMTIKGNVKKDELGKIIEELKGAS